MNKHYRLFLIFSIILITLFGFKLYIENTEGKKLSKLSIEYEAKSISNFLIAFRTIYQNIFIKNHIKLDESNIDFLPVLTTNEISKKFSSLNLQVKIATVSSRPRNPKNKANQRQEENIKYFKDNKDIKFLFKNQNDKYYFSKPMYISNTCLKCHGKKENAPKIIRENYNKSYNYKLGELRGIIDIEITQTDLSKLLEENNSRRTFAVVTTLIILIFTMFLYTRYNKRSDENIQKLNTDIKQKNKDLLRKEQELIKLNKTLEIRVAEAIEQTKLQQEQILQQSRLAQMGEMISMIAHQWRQPLAAISAVNASLNVKVQLGEMPNPDTILKSTNKVSSYLQHLTTTIDDFRDFFKPNKKKEDTTYNQILYSTLNIIEVSIATQNIKLIKNTNSIVVFHTYPNDLKQVLLNIIKNSKDALIENHIKDPYIKIETFDNILTIEDNAGGIESDIIDKIFDPYFSTKDEKNGTGLGLYMSKMIIEEHCNGKISVKNTTDGAMFTIDLGQGLIK